MLDRIFEFDAHGLAMGFAQQARTWTSRCVAQDPHGLLPCENVPRSSLVCVKCQKSDPHPTFLSPSRRAASLKQIREMLGVPEPIEKEPDKFLGDADAGADEPAPGYLCPVCQKGRMVPVRELPRPTVREIMAMPFPNQAYVEKQRKRLEGKRRRNKAAESRWLLVVPASELRQRLLPFGFT